MEQLLAEVADNMRRELSDNIRGRVKQQLLDRLLEANPLEVPRVLVENQVREMQIDAARRIGAKDASQLPSPDVFVEPARRRVGLGLLIGELIRTRGLQLDRARVNARLAELAATHPDPDAIMKAYSQNPDALRGVESMVLEDQVIEHLLEKARVTDQPATFKELLNFGA